MISMETILLHTIIIANILSFVTFGVDKLLAKLGRWRVPESVLLWTALLLGSAGALAGMVVFRHKTKKSKFTISVPMLFLFHLAVLGAVMF